MLKIRKKEFQWWQNGVKKGQNGPFLKNRQMQENAQRFPPISGNFFGSTEYFFTLLSKQNKAAFNLQSGYLWQMLSMAKDGQRKWSRMGMDSLGQAPFKVINHSSTSSVQTRTLLQMHQGEVLLGNLSWLRRCINTTDFPRFVGNVTSYMHVLYCMHIACSPAVLCS